MNMNNYATKYFFCGTMKLEFTPKPMIGEVKTEAHYSKPLISKAWFIYSYLHVMNRSDGDSLPRRLITS